ATVPSLLVRRIPGTSFVYLELNLRDPRLADRRVREALTLALDREGLVRFVLGGAARPATGLLAPEHWAYASTRQPRHDPRRARRLLDLAGYRALRPDTPRFRLVCKTSDQTVRRRLAVAVQAERGAVGSAVAV